MPFTVNYEIEYVPLPPEKELAWRAAISWLADVLMEIEHDDIDCISDNHTAVDCDAPSASPVLVGDVDVGEICDRRAGLRAPVDVVAGRVAVVA